MISDDYYEKKLDNGDYELINKDEYDPNNNSMFHRTVH